MPVFSKRRHFFERSDKVSPGKDEIPENMQIVPGIVYHRILIGGEIQNHADDIVNQQKQQQKSKPFPAPLYRIRQRPDTMWKEGKKQKNGNRNEEKVETQTFNQISTKKKSGCGMNHTATGTRHSANTAEYTELKFF